MEQAKRKEFWESWEDIVIEACDGTRVILAQPLTDADLKALHTVQTYQVKGQVGLDARALVWAAVLQFGLAKLAELPVWSQGRFLDERAPMVVEPSVEVAYDPEAASALHYLRQAE